MVLAARGLNGLKVAVTPAYVTVPITGVVPCCKVKVMVVVVKGSIASLKVAAIFWLTGTPVAAIAGTVKLTIGAVVSRAASVVKLQIKSLAPEVSALPARSLAPGLILAVYKVLGARLTSGMKVAVKPT